jgi:hypothetical protein
VYWVMGPVLLSGGILALVPAAVQFQHGVLGTCTCLHSQCHCSMTEITQVHQQLTTHAALLLLRSPSSCPLARCLPPTQWCGQWALALGLWQAPGGGGGGGGEGGYQLVGAVAMLAPWACCRYCDFSALCTSVTTDQLSVHDCRSSLPLPMSSGLGGPSWAPVTSKPAAGTAGKGGGWVCA